MSRIDIEPEEESNGLPPQVAVDEGQDPSNLRGQEGGDGSFRRNRSMGERKWKVHITIYLCICLKQHNYI